jgi:signal transduction histidine kinase
LLAFSGIRATWRSFDRLRGGIGPRLLARVLLFSLAITLVLTLFQLYLDYRHDVRAIESRMSEIEGSYLQSLGEGLWNLDRRQLELQIEGILRLPAIRFVEVRETTDRGDPMVVSGGRHQAQAAVRREFRLFPTARGEQQPLGVLSVEATLDEVYRALVDKAILILTSQGATIFLASFFIVYITHRLVTRHLTALAGFLRKYDLRQPPPPLRLQRRAPKDKDELDHVVAAFEIMRQTLERAYHDLRESEQRFRDYAETASDWFWATGPDHDFTDFSEPVGAVDMDRGELVPPRGHDAIGKRRWDVAADVASEPEKWREHIATVERRESFRDFVYKVRRADGSVGFVSISGKPVFDAEDRFCGYRGVARDITERKRAEEELRDREQRYRDAQVELAHVTRVTTLGELAASIAHEINQPLAAIVADADASLNWLARADPDLDRVRDALAGIVKDGYRAGEVIQRIRQLATKTEPQKARVDIDGVIRDVIPLLRNEVLSHHVSLRMDLAPALPPVLADRVQLQQVIINLVMNGIEAMASVSDRPRELVIRAQRHDVDQVVVTVRDAGVGIDPNKVDQLFGAFFTTKPGGMGMGLSISRSIIEAHGGKLSATANADHGATFHLVLPGMR